MVRQGSFPQLARILEEVHRANPMLDDDDDDDDGDNSNRLLQDEDEEDPMQPSRLRSLPGIPGEASVTMLSPELLQQLQRQSETSVPTSMAHESVSDNDSNDDEETSSHSEDDVDDSGTRLTK